MKYSIDLYLARSDKLREREDDDKVNIDLDGNISLGGGSVWLIVIYIG